jgi:hypothetical protein
MTPESFAFPILSRDLIACYDGNGSNFGTHPQNVLRGMVYEDNEWPYFFNLVDMYRHQAKYNDGYAYNMMFVGPGWLNKAGRWEAPYSACEEELFRWDRLLCQTQKRRQLIDMTMSEFAEYYRKSPHVSEPEVRLWKDIVYGSNKEYFWYVRSFFKDLPRLQPRRGDDRLKALCRQTRFAGRDWHRATPTIASYPYLIEANYRAGYFTHYAGQGTIKSCVIRYQGQECDLALERTLASYQKVGDDIELTTNPFEVVFKDLSFHMQSVYRFKKGTGEIVTTRRILDDLGGKSIEIEDYLVGCYGINEYSDDMSCVTLEVEGNQGKQSLQYAYKMRQLVGSDVSRAIIPPVNTIVEMGGDPQATVKAEEGIAFSPMFRLSVSQVLSSKGEFTSWLKVKKAR